MPHSKKFKIPPFPTFMIFIAITLTCISLVIFGFYSFNTAHKLKKEIPIGFHAFELQGKINHTNEILTMSARMYVFTGDDKWFKKYNYISSTLNNLTKEANQLLPKPELEKIIKQINMTNKQLTEMEYLAFNKMRTGDFMEAKQMLLGESYEAKKSIYSSVMEEYSTRLKELAKTRLNQLLRKMFYAALFLFAGFIVSLTSWVIVFRNIKSWKELLINIMANEEKNKRELEKSQLLLEQRVKERTNQLEISNNTMSATLNKLTQHEHEINLLNNMNELLQTCQTSQEAYSIINSKAVELFSEKEISGGLAIFNESTQSLEIIGQGGENPNLKKEFSSDDCWSLRMGHTYIVEKPDHNVICKHFKTPPLGGYICIPLMVRNKIIGLLTQSVPKQSIFTKTQQELSIAFSDVIKLSLANVQLQEKLQEQSIRDPLTGLFNRRYLHETLPRELHRVIREKETLSIAMLDLDDFKHFNDTYGHKAGDKVLEFVSQILLKNFRQSDIVCRFGGEEFVIILFENNFEKIIQKLNQLRLQVQKAKIIFQGQFLPTVTLSIGIARAPQHGTTTEEILHAADSALYTAKSKGKNNVIGSVED